MRLVLATHVFDQRDLLDQFFAWYEQLGVDAFLVQDMGSTDGSQDRLDQLARRHRIDWFSLEQGDLRQHRFGNTGDGMALLARERYDPEWLLMCDADEFLVLDGDDLPAGLERADANGVTALDIPCFNMTGRPLGPDGDALATLRLRIATPYVETLEQQLSGDLPQPYVFIRHPQKSIVRTAAFAGYRPGSHGVALATGHAALMPGAHFNHYLFRGYDKFAEKIRNAEAFLARNDHLPDWWGWHWRRWIRLDKAGGLRAEYDCQFVTADAEPALVATGACVPENRLADWTAAPTRPAAPAPPAGAIPGALPNWALCDAALDPPDWTGTADDAALAPFLFWLADAAQPVDALDLSASLLLAQALARCAPGSTLHRPSPPAEPASTIADAQRDLVAACLQTHTEPPTRIDLACIDSPDDLAPALAALSERGLLLLRFTRPGAPLRPLWQSLAAQHPHFEIFAGEGAGLLAIGAAPPGRIADLLALSPGDAARFRTLYARLGAALPKPVILAPDPTAELRERIATLTRERAAFEGGCAERDAIIIAQRAELASLRTAPRQSWWRRST